MILTNKLGAIIIEALQKLKEPAQLNEIVNKVASLTHFKGDDLEQAVLMCLEGGIRHGYIQKRRNKYAFKLCNTGFEESPSQTQRSPKKKFNQIAFTKKEELAKDTKSLVSDDITTLYKYKRPLRKDSVVDTKFSISGLVVKNKRTATNNPSINSLPELSLSTNVQVSVTTGKAAKKAKSLTSKNSKTEKKSSGDCQIKNML